LKNIFVDKKDWSSTKEGRKEFLYEVRQIKIFTHIRAWQQLKGVFKNLLKFVSSVEASHNSFSWFLRIFSTSFIYTQKQIIIWTYFYPFLPPFNSSNTCLEWQCMNCDLRDMHFSLEWISLKIQKKSQKTHRHVIGRLICFCNIKYRKWKISHLVLSLIATIILNLSNLDQMSSCF
jgi:hypothetical protein